MRTIYFRSSIAGLLLALSACATPPSYTVCNTDNCGDNVAITVSNEAK